MTDFILFREHFHDIQCPRHCRGYRNKAVAALFDRIRALIFGAKLQEMASENSPTPPSFLKQAINAVPAVKYALGVGGIISVIAIIRGFKIDFRVALLGTVLMLVLMTVLLIFAKAASRPQSAFKGPAVILTWFSLVLFIATASALFSSVFFGWPLDLRNLLAPAAHGQTINNGAAAPNVGVYELSQYQRVLFLKQMSAQTAPRDILRIGCTSWSESSCVAAGRFLFVLSEAGWQIEGNKVFRLEPQIPIVGVAIATRTPVGESKEPLPPHEGRWRKMDESHKTIYWAFNSLHIPVGSSTDDSLKEGTLGVYFGPEPK